jgi:hypothetical protein
MKRSQYLGMNSTTTSTAAEALKLPQSLDAGLPTNDISSVMVDDKLDANDNLQHFGLGPC